MNHFVVNKSWDRRVRPLIDASMSSVYMVIYVEKIFFAF